MEFSKVLETVGYLFYVVSPNRTTFEKIEDVPDYQIQVVPYFVVLVTLEMMIMRMKKNPIRLNDGMGSVSQGLLSETMRILLESWKLASYIYIYSNWRIVTLPWESLWTWLIAFITVDFIYYWAHRASHEINLLWAAHQVHHSSEDYNLTTALRQSVLQSYFVWVIPPLLLYGSIIYEIFSLSVLGIFLEARPYAAWMELLRCILYVAVDYYFIPWTRISLIDPLYQMAVLAVIRLTFLVSGIVWLRHCIKSVTIRWHSTAKKLD
ncbi:alkylglycerol monooxygenase [Caerostris darwini]|uniref:Alkylglycerol monooxygenase n=1 Tax=Caerostris darwini TaxID=1538125 RepID=A0AAV4TAQ0_9ARAC|nr:alkylglycerol monooxygenase [Caerostris darwini]